VNGEILIWVCLGEDTYCVELQGLIDEVERDSLCCLGNRGNDLWLRTVQIRAASLTAAAQVVDIYLMDGLASVLISRGLDYG
jgi:hypothetical protein